MGCKMFENGVCAGVEFLSFNVLLQHTKSEQKVLDWFCTQIIFKNPLRTGFSIRNILITICVRGVWIAMRYFLFEKLAFNRLSKVIGIQKYLQYKI